jgi:uncharacterized cupin superfamily protein
MKEIVKPAMNPLDVPALKGTSYPAPFADTVMAREKRKLGDALGLSNFGVNLVTLHAGCWSSQRHWHSKQDEFAYIVSGVLTLVTDQGEQELKAGMIAGFPAGKANGHHLINKSGSDAVYLEVGDRTAGDICEYPDIDMRTQIVEDGNSDRFIHKDGTPY